MPIFYPDILQETLPTRTFTYHDRDAMIYALGVGMGEDPLNARELPFVVDRKGVLKVLPTAVTVLANPPEGTQAIRASNIQQPGLRASRLNKRMVVHGEQKVEMHQAVLPPTGTFTITEKVAAAYDKGAGAGAVVYYESQWIDAAGDPLATLTMGLFARDDGGFGGPTDAPSPHVVPTRTPDVSVDFATRPGLALLYRMSGDRFPLHSDPAFAQAAGFPGPVLHGMCTYGITCRAILQEMTDFDPAAILSHQARFSAPVFCGDTITVDLWRDGKAVSFEARVKARGATVIKNGLTVLR